MQRSRDEVVRPTRGEVRLAAGHQVGGARPEMGRAGRLGQGPEHVEVGVARAAVVEDRRPADQQRPDEEVPHHPAGRRVPEEPVAGADVEVEPDGLGVLDDDAAVAVDDRLRQPGRAGREEDPQRVVEGDRLERERERLGGHESFPADPGVAGEARPPGRGPGSAPCARDAAAPPGSPRRPAGGRTTARRGRSRRRRSAPWARSGRVGR